MTILDNASLRDKLLNQFHINEYFESLTGLNFELVNYSRGEYILKEGQNTDCLVFLLVGRVKVYSCSVKREFGIVYVNKGLIGDVEFVNECTASRSVQVVNDALCLRLGTKTGRYRLMGDRKFLRYLTGELAAKLSLSDESSQNICDDLTTEDRLYEYLKISSVDGRVSGSLGDISKIMGISYRQLIRIMNALASAGKIKHGNKKGIYLIP